MRGCEAELVLNRVAEPRVVRHELRLVVLLVRAVEQDAHGERRLAALRAENDVGADRRIATGAGQASGATSWPQRLLRRSRKQPRKAKVGARGASRLLRLLLRLWVAAEVVQARGGVRVELLPPALGLYDILIDRKRLRARRAKRGGLGTGLTE